MTHRFYAVFLLREAFSGDSCLMKRPQITDFMA